MALRRLGRHPITPCTAYTLVMPVVIQEPTLTPATQSLACILQPNIDSSQCATSPVLQRQALFHCLTTPAPDIHGRPPPHHTAEDANTMQLWQADNRRFAPWQYQDKYLVAKPDGSRTLAPARMREQMMGFSGHHSSNMTHDPTEYHRNKSLRNPWHVPTATWLLFLRHYLRYPTG